MKRFSEYLNESCTPKIFSHGVMNHYTPIENILTNVKNLFCLPLGILAQVGQDGYSIELTSTDFISLDKINELLTRPMFNDVFTTGTSTLKGYIMSQGLPRMTAVNTGSFFVVYFSPDDIKAADSSTELCRQNDCPVPPQVKESLYDEFEMTSLLTEEDNSNDDSKSDDKPKDDSDMITTILNDTDKIKAANQLETVVSQKISYPRDYYFTAIKFKNGDEAIAFRWRYVRELPTGNSTETTRSLIHIFGLGDKAIWVQDYSKDSMVQLPDEAKKLIDNILNALGAKKTSDPSIYSLGKSDSNKEEDNKDHGDSSDDNSNDDSNNDTDDNNNSKDQDDKK